MSKGIEIWELKKNLGGNAKVALEGVVGEEVDSFGVSR
jgi:hypothetical protein